MTKNIFDSIVDSIIRYFIAIIIGAIIGYVYCLHLNKPIKDSPTLPVEGIDSIKPIELKIDTIRDTIYKIKIIKEHEIEKVKTLDADSSIKLLKELLSE